MGLVPLEGKMDSTIFLDKFQAEEQIPANPPNQRTSLLGLQRIWAPGIPR